MAWVYLVSSSNEQRCNGPFSQPPRTPRASSTTSPHRPATASNSDPHHPSRPKPKDTNQHPPQQHKNNTKLISHLKRIPQSLPLPKSILPFLHHPALHLQIPYPIKVLLFLFIPQEDRSFIPFCIDTFPFASTIMPIKQCQIREAPHRDQ